MDTYEKAYKEALERAKSEWVKNLDNTYKNYRERLEIIFPELKESEEEKIKEDLIQWINEFPDTIWRGHYKKDIIAWLEKQGEQKSIYVVTRSEEHSDYVEAVFLSENEAKEYCKPYNQDKDSYVRNITKMKIQ